MILCHAYAKVNLTLEVLGRRADGYHDLVSVVQTIDLHDDLRILPAATLTLECADPSLAGNDNLVLRAAALLRARTTSDAGARLVLEKRIPLAAGLGGGSADAAAALLGLCRLWGVRLSDAELAALAAVLGSDVPLFLHGGTALIQGRGEAVSPLPPAPARHLVLLRPPTALAAKTATLYGQLSAADFGDGTLSQEVVATLERGEFPAENLLRNTFERVAEAAFPGLAEACAAMSAAAGRPAHLSGAGPTLYAVFAEQAHAEAVASTLRAAGHETYLARTGNWRSQAMTAEDTS